MLKKVALLLCLLVSIAIGVVAWNNSGFRYVQEVTRVRLPAGCTSERTRDNGNGRLWGVAKLPTETVQQFLEEYQFKSVAAMPSFEDALNDPSGSLQFEKPLLIFGIFENEPGFPTFPDKSTLMYLRGMRGDRWPWEFIVDSKTGQLWVFVVSPDMAGT